MCERDKAANLRITAANLPSKRELQVVVKRKLVFPCGRTITKPVLWLPWVPSNICVLLLPEGRPGAQTAVDDHQGDRFDNTGQLKIIVVKRALNHLHFCKVRSRDNFIWFKSAEVQMPTL